MTPDLPIYTHRLYNHLTKRMRVSIQSVVIVFFLFATIITATVAISLQYVFSRNLAIETTLTLFENATQSTQEYLKELDKRASSSVKIMSKLTHFDENNVLSRESYLLFTEVMLSNPLFHSVYVGLENGDYFGIINLNADKQTREKLNAQPTDRWIITQISGHHNTRKRIMKFVDSEFITRTTRKISADFKSNNRPWFIGASKDKVHKTFPYLFHQLQTPGESYSMQLPSKNAVFGVNITLSAISDYLKSLNSPLNSEIYLFNDRGDLTASNQPLKEHISLPPSPQMILTEKQKKLIQNTPHLNVSNEMDWPPISFSVSGKPTGFAIDVLNYISEMTGIKIRYVNGLAWNQFATMFFDDELDVLQPVYFDPFRKWLGNLSESFLSVPYGVLTAKGQKPIKHIDQLKGKTVAIPDGWLLTSNLAEQFPDINVVKVPNVRAMFDAVREGTVDAAMDTSAVFNYKARQFFIDDVVINSPLKFGQIKLPENLQFMLAKGKPELKLLFDQALQKLGPEYQQALAEKWFSTEKDQAYYKGGIPYKKLIKMAQQGGSEGLVTVDMDGKKYYTYMTPFDAHNDRNDFFAIVAPVENVLSAAVDKIIDAIIITIIVLILLLPIAWLLAGPLVKPIRQLAQNSKHIAHRRYNQVSDTESQIVELHDLAISMDDMSASIQQHEQAHQNLLDALIKLIAQAIDDKSAHTAGHCERVPELAFILIKQASESSAGVFEDFSFTTSQQWREFEVAAWLHDCGKITTPEHIIDKGTKLEVNYNRIHEIRMRFEVLWRDAEIDYLTKAKEVNVDEALLYIDKLQKQQTLQDDFSFIANANIGGEFMSEEDIERVKQLAKTEWQRNFNERLGLSHIELIRYNEDEQALPVTEYLLADKQQHMIKRKRDMVFDPQLGIKMDVPEYLSNMGELHNLSIKRGTLTAEDRFKINEHIISTIKMLENLPFPDELSKVPRYASTHHETMIGTGYPRKLSAEDLSIPERIMVVADIFEALTAADRPYKKAKSISKSIDILHKMALNQHVDIEVFELLLTSGAYLEYAKRFLPEEQVDEVDINKYLR
jgi:HD-GYP domain-containing protein (c-di-GMP phosphodiesterase class II)/ABC-type amino acid transport substrate-binding protein